MATRARIALRTSALYKCPCVTNVELFRSPKQLMLNSWRSEARTWSCAFLSSTRVKLWGVLQKGESFLWLRSRSLMGSERTPVAFSSELKHSRRIPQVKSLQPTISWFICVKETTPTRRGSASARPQSVQNHCALEPDAAGTERAIRDEGCSAVCRWIMFLQRWRSSSDDWRWWSAGFSTWTAPSLSVRMRNTSEATDRERILNLTFTYLKRWLGSFFKK